MRGPLFQVILLVVSFFPITLEKSVAGQQGSPSEDRKYAGTWTGSYNNDNGGTGNLSYVFSKDEKGQWRGTATWTTQEGEKTAELKPLHIADGKMKAKLETGDGQVEVPIEGEFQQSRLEGMYSVLPKGTTEVAEKGTWKVSKRSAKKTGR